MGDWVDRDFEIVGDTGWPLIAPMLLERSLHARLPARVRHTAHAWATARRDIDGLYACEWWQKHLGPFSETRTHDHAARAWV